jgi:hypothetical protein
MSFWQATMRRSARLSRTYIILGVAMSVVGTVVSNMFSLIPANLITLEGIPIDMMNSIPFASIALVSMSALIFSTPVVMLFVFDKNTGVIEYLLSTGLDQLDVFKGYMKASLSLASILLALSVVFNTIMEIYLGNSLDSLASKGVLMFAMGISGVLLATAAMMAFSSLQKTQMGANQPLGPMIGMIPILPALMVPFAFPSYAMVIIISIVAVTSLVSFALLLFSSRLIPREKLLP